MNRTVIDCGGIGLAGCKTREELLTYAAEDTFAAGTILARLATVLAITPSAITGTGNGTLTLATVTGSPLVPKVGSWVLRCTLAVAHGGVWRLEDPDGAIVATGLTMTAGAGVATAFESNGLAFTLTDGSTDFVAGDLFTLPVVASGKLVPYNPAGAGGAQIPRFVLPTEQYKAAAGDKPVTVICGGDVKKDRLIIDVDGTGANITAAILDQLRDVGTINAVDTKQLSALDNA